MVAILSAASSFGSQTKRHSKANTKKSAWNWAVRSFLDESCAAGQGTGKSVVRYLERCPLFSESVLGVVKVT
jgi:hypothetical protein